MCAVNDHVRCVAASPSPLSSLLLSSTSHSRPSKLGAAHSAAVSSSSATHASLRRSYRTCSSSTASAGAAPRRRRANGRRLKPAMGSDSGVRSGAACHHSWDLGAMGAAARTADVFERWRDDHVVSPGTYDTVRRTGYDRQPFLHPCGEARGRGRQRRPRVASSGCARASGSTRRCGVVRASTPSGSGLPRAHRCRQRRHAARRPAAALARTRRREHR